LTVCPTDRKCAAPLPEVEVPAWINRISSARQVRPYQ